MVSRRHFIRTATGSAVGLAASPLLGSSGARVLAHQTDDWYGVQQAFSVDRSLIHLNSGGVCPAPTSVLRSLSAHQAASNRRPFYAHESEVLPQIESIRGRLAATIGCDPEEIALTRNTSEGMEICQLGIELNPGDEILTTDHDYPRMLATWGQRAAREGIRIRRVAVPVPLSDPTALVTSISDAITDRTRLIMCCHVVDLTGQILPVAEIVAAGHAKGIKVLVDGAQSFGHIPFRLADLGCDFFATSLHKWMMGPEGTGLLYVRRDLIRHVWPLMPAEDGLEDNIRKFEDTGTKCHAPALAVAEALQFHEGIGCPEKFERVRFLRDYWLDGLMDQDRIELLTDVTRAGSLATIAVEGLNPGKLRSHLWNQFRIRVRPIEQENVSGIRVSPGIYTTLPELDRFIAVMKTILNDGIPTT
ncbi:MAG: isopenicillin-N epimerase [Rhodothermales bacterium]|jgi:isopenicillin-N epimerase